MAAIRHGKASTAYQNSVLKVAECTRNPGAYVLLASRENSAAMTGEIIASDGGLRARGVSALSGVDHLLAALASAGPA